MLASDAGDILTPVPTAATAGVNRLKNVQVQPGQSVFDVLVFEAPPQPFESLKLALAKSAVADAPKGTGRLRCHWKLCFASVLRSRAPHLPLKVLWAVAQFRRIKHL